MRTIIGFITVALLAGASASLAKPPTPIPCPDDVGAALAAQCPCEGRGGQAWKNHGGYVSCVVRYRNALRKSGCLDDAAKRTIARCAARSTCGKEGAVLCCVYDTSGTCDDPVPGDATAAGVCSNDATVACDTDLDCVTATGPTVARHEERCTDKGGTAVGGGSVCSSCPSPTAAPTPGPTPAP
jgi:hypothetical protein